MDLLKIRTTKLLLPCALVLLLAACLQSTQRPINTEIKPETVLAPTPGKVTERQLQAEVMAFADQYSMVIWQAMDELHRSDLPPDKKLAVEYNKLLYTSSAISIAAQPSPVASLLDMITFVRLGHKAAETYWVPEVYGPSGKTLIAAYQRLEGEVWQLAALVLSEQQQETVRITIDRWQQEHPNQWYVSDVRLQDFSAARGRPVHPFAGEYKGLLGSIDQTLQEVDDAMLVADRALFLGERMPRLITLQTELLLDQVTEHPMVHQVAGDLSELQKTAALLGETIEKLPRTFAAERQATLDEIGSLLNRQRIALFQDFNDNEKLFRSLMGDSQATLRMASQTAQDYAALMQTLQELVGKEEGDTIGEVTILAEKAQKVGAELNLLLDNIDRFVSTENMEEMGPHIRQMIMTVKVEEERLIDRAFVLAAVLILLALAGSLGVALSYRFLSERLFHKHPQE